MKKEIVTLKDISVEFEGNTVLHDHNLTVYDDDFIGIIGPNGGGKTTLLKVILGLVKPSHGEISVFGTSPDKARKQVGYVPQMMEVERDFPISVWDTVLMGRLAHKGHFKGHNKKDYEQVDRVLEIVEMSDIKNRKTGALSGGERQRVMIARARVILRVTKVSPLMGDS